MQILTDNQAVWRVRELVQQLKSELQLLSAPTYPETANLIVRHLGLSVEEHNLPFDEGQYYPDQRLIVISTQLVDPGRRNFTFFHEVSHHLIRVDDELYAFVHEYACRDDDFKIVLERYCNIGAAEFLIPAKDVLAAFANHGFSIQLIPNLDAQYPASTPAIATQLAQCASHKCFIVVCAYGALATPQTQLAIDTMSAKTESQLYVAYSVGSSSIEPYRVARYTAIPRDHILHEAWTENHYVRRKDCIPFRNNRGWIVDCEALPYKGKVYAAFHASSPPDATAHLRTLFDL